MDQTLWPPPNIPDWQKATDWHRERVRRQRSNTSTEPQSSNWQWKIGAVGKWEIIQALHQQDGKGRKNIVHVLRTEDPYTHAHVRGTRRGVGRSRGVMLNEYLTICCGTVDKTSNRAQCFSQRCHALRIGTQSCPISAPLSLTGPSVSQD